MLSEDGDVYAHNRKATAEIDEYYEHLRAVRNLRHKTSQCYEYALGRHRHAVEQAGVCASRSREQTFARNNRKHEIFRRLYADKRYARRNSFVRPSVRLQSRQVCRTPSSPEAGAAYRFLRRGRLRIYSRMQSHTFDEYVESQYVGRTFKRYVFPQGLSHYVFRRNS